MKNFYYMIMVAALCCSGSIRAADDAELKRFRAAEHESLLRAFRDKERSQEWDKLIKDMRLAAQKVPRGELKRTPKLATMFMDSYDRFFEERGNTLSGKKLLFDPVLTGEELGRLNDVVLIMTEQIRKHNPRSGRRQVESRLQVIESAHHHVIKQLISIGEQLRKYDFFQDDRNKLFIQEALHDLTDRRDKLNRAKDLRDADSHGNYSIYLLNMYEAAVLRMYDQAIRELEEAYSVYEPAIPQPEEASDPELKENSDDEDKSHIPYPPAD